VSHNMGYQLLAHRLHPHSVISQQNVMCDLSSSAAVSIYGVILKNAMKTGRRDRGSGSGGWWGRELARLPGVGWYDSTLMDADCYDQL
jgi:hypothetical protein